MKVSTLTAKNCSRGHASLITFVLLTVLPVQAARQALVIGNDNYTSQRVLLTARNDATAMARELKAAVFTVQLSTPTLGKFADQTGFRWRTTTSSSPRRPLKMFATARHT